MQNEMKCENYQDQNSNLATEVLKDGNQLDFIIVFFLVGSVTDAPNDVIYMVCGVLIAMLLVGLIIVLVAVTIK
jgi:hypothetical protein